jgi:Na+/H+ antiporter NhaD/arsenite permease-like protein
MTISVGAVTFIVGVIVTALVLAAVIRANNARRRKAKASPAKKGKPVEFSKLILLLVMLAYFIVVGVGVRLSFIDYMQYSTLAMLVGAPTAVALGFYAWKAKSENVLKYKKENKKETEGVPFDPGNIT